MPRITRVPWRRATPPPVTHRVIPPPVLRADETGGRLLVWRTEVEQHPLYQWERGRFGTAKRPRRFVAPVVVAVLATYPFVLGAVRNMLPARTSVVMLLAAVALPMTLWLLLNVWTLSRIRRAMNTGIAADLIVCGHDPLLVVASIVQAHRSPSLAVIVVLSAIAAALLTLSRTPTLLLMIGLVAGLSAIGAVVKRVEELSDYVSVPLLILIPAIEDGDGHRLLLFLVPVALHLGGVVLMCAGFAIAFNIPAIASGLWVAIAGAVMQRRRDRRIVERGTEKLRADLMRRVGME